MVRVCPRPNLPVKADLHGVDHAALRPREVELDVEEFVGHRGRAPVARGVALGGVLVAEGGGVAWRDDGRRTLPASSKQCPTGGAPVQSQGLDGLHRG